MSLLLSIAGILVTIFFVVGTHEAAHFMAARALSVKVLTFSIGFGKTLFRWHDKSGTEYIFALIPLGGYVRMLDENEGNVPESELKHAFNRQPFYKKFIIVLAGPMMNFLCAFLLYWLIFVMGFTTIKPIIGTVAPTSIAANAGLKANQEILSMDGRQVTSWMNIMFRLLSHLGDRDKMQLQAKIGETGPITTHTLNLKDWQIDDLKPEPLTSLGITPFEPVIPLVIGVINPESAAAKSSLQLGDKITHFNGKKVSKWQELIQSVYENPNKAVTITVERAGKSRPIQVTLGEKKAMFAETHGVLGIGPSFSWPKESLLNVQYSMTAAIPRAWQEISDLAYFNLVLFGKMVTGKLSLQSLGGPITIFETAGDALNSGMLAFLSFLAFLSLSIGIINILPIPGLDGGHLFLQIIELVIRRPIPERILLLLFRLGFVLIFFVLFHALWNDILRIYY